jgi:hypothetical protein
MAKTGGSHQQQALPVRAPCPLAIAIAATMKLRKSALHHKKIITVVVHHLLHPSHRSKGPNVEYTSSNILLNSCVVVHSHVLAAALNYEASRRQ